MANHPMQDALDENIEASDVLDSWGKLVDRAVELNLDIDIPREVVSRARTAAEALIRTIDEWTIDELTGSE